MNTKIELIYLILGINFLSEFLIVKGSKAKYVTCGSMIKLLNSDYDVRLHSHDVKYGSGSGQQSVTATEVKEDVGSNWNIKAATGKTCERGKPIECGDTIRFQHLTTKKNLHSHHFPSPLSGYQEISCYGNEGLGDTGDHWEIICGSNNWSRSTPIKLRHTDTGSYLGLSGRTFGRPISGQMEVVGFTDATHRGTDWITAEGVFILPKETKDHYPHTEL